MYCPFCSHEETKVIDSRLAGDGRQIRRRRQCLRCNERFTTFETAELVMPRIVKNDNSRQPFDESKVRNSMRRALEKRPVPSDEFEQAVGKLVHKLRTMGEREVPSRLVGELLDYKTGVLTAESETVGHNNFEIGFPCNIRNVVEVAVRVRLFLIDRRVEDSIDDAINADDSFQ